jgi:hypothetical protein
MRRRPRGSQPPAPVAATRHVAGTSVAARPTDAGGLQFGSPARSRAMPLRGDCKRFGGLARGSAAQSCLRFRRRNSGDYQSALAVSASAGCGSLVAVTAVARRCRQPIAGRARRARPTLSGRSEHRDPVVILERCATCRRRSARRRYRVAVAAGHALSTSLINRSGRTARPLPSLAPTPRKAPPGP